MQQDSEKDYIEEEGDLWIQAEGFIKSDKFQEAEEVLTKLISHNESNALAFRKRADVYLKNGKYIQALHDIERAMLLDPQIECCKSSYEHYQIKKGLMRMSNDI